ncbi:MAG: hypothetical protein ACO3ZW_07060 [Opitutales bacterium]|jgi:hypothetical protein
MNLSFLQDLRFGLRQVYRSPYSTGLAIFCLAAGIGLSTFMFSITYSVVGRGVPVEDQEQIIHVIRQSSPEVSDGRTLIHLDDYPLIEEQQTSFSHLTAMPMDGVTVCQPDLVHTVPILETLRVQ